MNYRQKYESGTVDWLTDNISLRKQQIETLKDLKRQVIDLIKSSTYCNSIRGWEDMEYDLIKDLNSLRASLSERRGE